MEEIDQLLEARFIQEVQYPKWLANVFMVPKKNSKWRVCIDFTNLNEAFLKNSFLLYWIDQIVDVTIDHELFFFLDAFFEYNQIPIYLPYAEKMTFITSWGLLCYDVMSFSLKNVGATYQRLMMKIFQHLLGQNIEFYIDDMLIKRKLK